MIDERVLAQAIEQTERRHAEPTVTADGAVWLTIVCATWAVMVDYLAGAGLISGRDRAAALSEGHAHGGPLRVGRLDSTLFRAQARAAAADCECDGITAFDAFGRPIRVGACPTCDAPFRLLTADEQALAEMRQGATAYIRAGERPSILVYATSSMGAKYVAVDAERWWWVDEGREELLTTMQRQGWTWAEDLLATSTLHVDMIDEDDLACARAEVNTRALARTDAENAHWKERGLVTEARASAAEELAGLVLHEVGEQLSRVYRGWRIDHDTGLKGPKTREGQGVERIADEHLAMQNELEHARGERGSRDSIGVHIDGEEIIVRNTSFGLRVDPVSIEKTRDAIRAKREAATAKLRGAHAGKSEALERALVGLGKVDAVLLGRPVDGRVYEGEIGDLLARLSDALPASTPSLMRFEYPPRNGE